MFTHGYGSRVVAFQFFENFFEKQRLFFGILWFVGIGSLFWSRLTWFLLFNVPVVLVAIKNIIFSSFDQCIAQHQFKFKHEIISVLLVLLSWFARLVGRWFWFGSFASPLLSSHIYNYSIEYCCIVLLFSLTCLYDLLFTEAIKKYIFSSFLSNSYIYVVIFNIIIFFINNIIIVVDQLIDLVLLYVYRHTDAIKKIYPARCWYTFCFPRSFLPIRLILTVWF